MRHPHHHLRELHSGLTAVVLGMVLTLVPGSGQAQQAPGAESVYQRFAPIDLTGTWVSIVSEDWRMRMIVPPRGDFQNLPLTQAAQDAANAMDLDQIAAAGLACQAYAAPTIMREPGRVQIAWEDADTLRIDTDAGEQTRLIHFVDQGVPEEPSWQGHSVAEWEYAGGFDPLRAIANDGRAGGGRGGRGGGGRGGGGRGGDVQTPMGGKLRVETTNLRAGLLRKNGVPFSANTEITEYYNLLTEPDGIDWFVVTTIVHDPENLLVDYITSTNFRREPDDSNWSPTPCSLE